eukprot:5648103-Alexandrium_andersonii.AAC.1
MQPGSTPHSSIPGTRNAAGSIALPCAHRQQQIAPPAGECTRADTATPARRTRRGGAVAWRHAVGSSGSTVDYAQ